jgi:NitT/TauT family transport system ATP-binding protein
MGYFSEDKKGSEKETKKSFSQEVTEMLDGAKKEVVGLVGIPQREPIIKKSSDERYGDIDIIDLKNITQVYEEKGEKHVVFDNFNLQIKDVKDRGQFVVMVGASGCGKSTLLRYIAGLQKPTSGEILFRGIPQTKNDRVGMVFQQYSSFPWRTVLDNVCFPLELQGIPRKEREDKSFEMIKLVGLEGHEYKFAQYPILSGGQLQRVAIARSLVSGSEILLMDEPFGALDVSTRLSMQELICNIWTKMPGDPTVILVTHDLSEAVYLADEIIVLDANPGRIVEKIILDLPWVREKSLKRTKKFIDYTHYLEDLMMKIEKKNK